MGQNGRIQIHHNTIDELLFTRRILQYIGSRENSINKFSQRLSLLVKFENNMVAYHSFPYKVGGKLLQQVCLALFPTFSMSQRVSKNLSTSPLTSGNTRTMKNLSSNNPKACMSFNLLMSPKMASGSSETNGQTCRSNSTATEAELLPPAT